MDTEIILTLKRFDRLFANDRRIRLLKNILATGSISQAAKQTDISYKTAWNAISEMNEIAGQPLIASTVGGKGGGGAILTSYSLRLIKLYDLLAQFQQNAFDILQDESVSLDNLLNVIARFSLQTSARNQLFATIRYIEKNDINVLVHLLLKDQKTPLIAKLTQQSAERLQLYVGKEVIALIKAPWINLSLQPVASSDNQLSGILQSIQQNSHDTELLINIGIEQVLCATISTESYLQAPMKINQQIYAHFSAKSIIIATLV